MEETASQLVLEAYRLKAAARECPEVMRATGQVSAVSKQFLETLIAQGWSRRDAVSSLCNIVAAMNQRLKEEEAGQA